MFIFSHRILFLLIPSIFSLSFFRLLYSSILLSFPLLSLLCYFVVPIFFVYPLLCVYLSILFICYSLFLILVFLFLFLSLRIFYIIIWYLLFLSSPLSTFVQNTLGWRTTSVERVHPWTCIFRQHFFSHLAFWMGCNILWRLRCITGLGMDKHWLGALWLAAVSLRHLACVCNWPWSICR